MLLITLSIVMIIFWFKIPFRKKTQIEINVNSIKNSRCPNCHERKNVEFLLQTEENFWTKFRCKHCGTCLTIHLSENA